MKNKTDINARRMARLAAVQGLYQIALLPRATADIIREFRDQPSLLLHEAETEESVTPEIDQHLFAEILEGVNKQSETLDQMIAGAFDSKISSDRIEILLRAILRCGAYELHHHSKVPAGVIINDYVDVAHAFFNAKEPSLVNAVLDKMAKNLRAA